MGDRRPGDNLYILHPRAGCRHRRDQGTLPVQSQRVVGLDEVSPPILVDFQRNGRTFKGLIDVARDGYLWFLHRGDPTTGGRIKFIEGKPYVYQNVFRGLDPELDVPTWIRRTSRGPESTPTIARNCTAARIGLPSLQSQDATIYIPANNNMCGSSTGTDIEYSPGKGFTEYKSRPPAFDRARDPFRRSSSLERGHRQAGMEVRLCEESKLGDPCW